MTLQNKIIAVSVVGVTLIVVMAIGNVGGSEGTVNKVKRLMGFNPLSEQELVPLPGGVKSPGTVSLSEERAYDISGGFDEDEVGSDKFASTVFEMVNGSEITMPDGRTYSENTEAIHLDDYDWEAE